jgi:site-specific DNA-methyltransferase (cytosine-N4-specific)
MTDTTQTAVPAPWWTSSAATLYVGDAREVLAQLPEESADCIVTSPPYFGLRSYDTGTWHDGQENCSHIAQPRPEQRCPQCGARWVDRQYGQEESVEAYVENLLAVFDQARRVLHRDGTLWLNLGDTYAGNKTRSAPRHGTSSVMTGEYATRKWMAGAVPGVPPKSLVGVPWRVALGLQQRGWILRNAAIWAKTNSQPSPVLDRLTSTYEMLFMLTRSQHYYFDLDAIRVPPKNPDDPRRRTARGKNPGDVWNYPTRPLREAHFAAYPIEIPLRCIAAGCRPQGAVLDPFSGVGTTGLAALRLGRLYAGIDLGRSYAEIARRRLLDQGEVTQ